MSKTLIINPIKEEIYYTKFLIDGFADCEFLGRESLNETLTTEPDLIDSVDILIVAFNMKGFSALLKELQSETNQIKTIITFKQEESEAVEQHITYNPNIVTYCINGGDVAKLESSYRRLSKLQERTSKGASYCRVRIDYFLKFSKVICDVFIKLSEEKYIKIINRHQEYSEDDINKYIDKECNHLYIKEFDFKLFVNGVVKNIQEKNHSKLPVLAGENSFIPLTCQETVHEMVHKMGLSTQALMLTNEAINSTIKLVQKNDVYKLLKKTLGEGTYISEISMLVNYISCAICRESEWKAPDNYLRLSIASFFQNISLNEDNLAKIEMTSTPEFEDLFNTSKKKVTEHPSKSADQVLKIKGLPIGVDKIIMNHHERYDGKGFPRGIDYTRLDPMTSIFVVSLELANTLYETGFYRDAIIEKILEMESRYTKGSFAKIMSAMKVAFAIPLIEHDRQDFLNE